MVFQQRCFPACNRWATCTGNYLGAIKFVELQKSHDRIYCVVDLHAITVCGTGRAQVEHPRRDRGLNAARHRFKAAHRSTRAKSPNMPSLVWIFNCVARLGWLNRMTCSSARPARTARTLRRPVRLSEPDGGRHTGLSRNGVPVGETKSSIPNCRVTSHKSSTTTLRDRSARTASASAFFPQTGAADPGTGDVQRVLRDGTKKMSKSDASDQSRINLIDDADTIVLKIRRAKIDPDPLPYDLAALEKRPRPTIWWKLSLRLQRFQRPRFSNNLEARKVLGVQACARRTPSSPNSA